MEPNLLPIGQITKATKTDKIHLAYLTKLRILPQTIRRKINGAIHGCYPESVIPTILKAEQLKNSGLTYSQIKFQLSQKQQAPNNSQFPNYQIPNYSLAFLIVGLLLGYLLATRPLNPVTPVQAVAAVSPLDVQSQTMIKVVAENNSDSNEPIYLLAVPQKNFSRLGINYDIAK